MKFWVPSTLNIIHILKPVLGIVIVHVKRIVLVLATTWTILALRLVHFVRCVFSKCVASSYKKIIIRYRPSLSLVTRTFQFVCFCLGARRTRSARAVATRRRSGRKKTAAAPRSTRSKRSTRVSHSVDSDEESNEVQVVSAVLL
jgi:hypothetical protein